MIKNRKISPQKKMILYLGFNGFSEHKRGVENVIEFQSKAFDFDYFYYLHWGSKTSLYKYDKFICISIKHCWYWPLVLNLAILHLLSKRKFVIHSHNPLFSFFSFVKTDILTVHDGLYYLSISKKKKSSYVFKVIEFLLYFRCTFVHFISKYTKDNTLFGNRKNFAIIPNTSHFEQLATNINIKKESNQKINILIVRSIEERARIDLVIKVAKELRDDNFMFTIAGKGPLLSHYQQIIINSKLKNIEMLGYVNDEKLLSLYAKCDCVLMIAEFGEGFGLPIIEGYLFDKPVIASNKCAIPEVIISDDYLFDNNPSSIIHKLISIKNISKSNFRQFYDMNYSNSKILSEFREIYYKSLS